MEINGNKKSQKVAKSRKFTLNKYLFIQILLNNTKTNNDLYVLNVKSFSC